MRRAAPRAKRRHVASIIRACLQRSKSRTERRDPGGRRHASSPPPEHGSPTVGRARGSRRGSRRFHAPRRSRDRECIELSFEPERLPRVASVRLGLDSGPASADLGRSAASGSRRSNFTCKNSRLRAIRGALSELEPCAECPGLPVVGSPPSGPRVTPNCGRFSLQDSCVSLQNTGTPGKRNDSISSPHCRQPSRSSSSLVLRRLAVHAASV